MRRIHGSPAGGTGLPLPGQPTAVSMWVNPEEPREQTTLWLRTKDAAGTFRLHELGRLDFEGYQRMEAQLQPERLGVVYPIAIVSVLMTQAEGLPDPRHHVYFDDIAAVDADGNENVVEDFETGFRWEAVRTATREQDELIQSGEAAYAGSSAARFSFRTGTSAPTRGLQFADPNIPLPVLASRNFMVNAGVRVGEEAELVLGRVLIPVVVQGVVNHFPTMFESRGGYVILNQEHLYHYAGVANQRGSVSSPSEAWLTISPDSEIRQEVRTALLDSFGIPHGQIIDRQLVLEDLRTDPIVRAGGSGVLLLALVASFAILALGFGLTLYLGGQARTVEVAVMRAVGISPRQLFAMIGLEYLLVAVIGLIIGTIAGLRISETMLAFLNVRPDGGIVVPPFDLATNWGMMAVAYGATALAFLAGIVLLGVYFLRLPVSRIIRLTR